MPKSLVKASDVIEVNVENPAKESLGKIKDVMIDKLSGRVAYVVLESGTILGLGGKLFALPWNSIHYNKEEETFIQDADKEKLKSAPGFAKDNWPNMEDKQWGLTISQYYGSKPYWE